MTDEEYYAMEWSNSSGGLRTCIAWLVGSILAILLTGCKETEYVPVPEYHYDYHHSTDTIRERDSVFREKETIIREADSALLAQLGIQLAEGQRAIVVLQKELERIRNERQETTNDTVVRVDSIRVPYPVERKLTWWEQTKMDYGAAAMGGSLVAVVLAVLLLLRWLRKKDR